MLPLDHVIALSVILFTIGVLGVATRRNLIVMLMSIELMLNAANLAFVGFNRIWSQIEGAPAIDGQVFVLIVIAVAAAEVAVGLGILLSMFRNRDSVNVEEVNLLKWWPLPQRAICSAGFPCYRCWSRPITEYPSGYCVTRHDPGLLLHFRARQSCFPSCSHASHSGIYWRFPRIRA